MDFQIKFLEHQPRDFAGRFAKVGGATMQIRRSQLDGGMRALVNLLRDEAPVRSGAFRKGIGYRINQTSPLVIQGETFAPEPLATFIKGGTKPHDILPRRGNVLAFFWADGPRGPGTYFFPKVHHPGTKANPYHERALQRWRPIAKEVLAKMAKSYIAYTFQ